MGVLQPAVNFVALVVEREVPAPIAVDDIHNAVSDRIGIRIVRVPGFVLEAKAMSHFVRNGARNLVQPPVRIGAE